MPEVVNPAVIIGLGGTGKWVLTYVKKNLLDTYGGEMPKTVRLLSFDTTSEKISRDGVPQEEDARVGNVQLDKQAEFVYLGGNIQQICREVRDEGRHPHIRSWLQARTYLQTADSDAFDISRGAGQKRPFGRMAIFYDLQQLVQSRIINKIETALAEVLDANSRQAPVEIYIVASLAGGTGAGMFIDVAHLTRWFANRQIRSGFAIRGFLALQNTFRSVIKTEHVQPQVFAAMRELDRFMLVFDQHYPMIYNPTTQDLNTIYGGQLGKLFDNCYLLDASREHLPLDGFEPKYGVYPSIADSITMLLDGSTGDSYAQHYKNVNTRIADVQSKTKQPIYSSLGTYSLILPVEDIITSLSYRFATDLLGEHLLDLRARTTDTGQTQQVLYHESDARKDAATFLRAPRSSSGILSTNFIQLTPAVVDSWKARAEPAIAEIAARGAPELLTWILPPETDPAIEAITRKVRDDLEVTLSSRVLLSSGEGDDPVEGSNRIQRGVREFRAAQMGRDVDGRYVGGLYRTALDQCATVHRERFRKLLAEHMLNLLNGPDPRNKDYQREKRGKLGQAQDMLTQLARYFSDLSAALSQIKSHRVALDELRAAQEEAALYRLEMDAKKSKKGPLGILVKNWQPAVQAQRTYLDAEWRVIEIEVKDLFFDMLQQISDMLRAATEEYKTAIDAWIATLAHGATGALADPGLYRHLQRTAAQHNANREDKKRIGVHEYLTDDEYENELYRGVTQGKFAAALTQLVWEIEPQRDTFRLVLRGCHSLSASPTDGRSATERNAEFLLNIARDYCAPLRDLTIADRLVEREVNRLAGTLLDKCGPMIRYDPAKTGGEQETHFFICVNEGGQKAYFNEFRAALRRLGTSARDNQILASANPYVCTILATADVIASPSLLAYTAAEREYNNYAGDARLLHVFPAEVNAVQLEQQLPSIREPRRRFSPILTAMLEDRGTVDLFILAYLYRLLRLEDSGGVNGSRWVLFVPASPLRGEERFALTPPDRRPSLCAAMERFVFHRSDINNPTHKIDLLALEHALRKHEAQASGGDESRLINLLEAALADGIESLRTSPDVNLRDIASLMRLVVEEIVQGLFDRVRASGKHYDPDAAPLVQMVMQNPARAAKPASNGHGGMPSGMQANGGGTQKTHAPTMAPPATETSGGSARDKLRQLKELLDDGLIVLDEYEAKRREILSR